MRRVRLLDIAARAGVSRPAVARVLLGTGAGHVRVSDEVADRIQRIATELQYRPNRVAQQLKGVRSGTIGVLLDTDNRAVMGDRLIAIERAAAQRGLRLLVGWVQGDAGRLSDYLEDFHDRCEEGLIVLFDVTSHHDRLLKQCIPAGANVVYHARPLRRGDACVCVDTAAGIAQLVRHLSAQGCTRIGLELWNTEDRLMEIRRSAYSTALKRMGHTVDPALIWTGHGMGSDPQPHDLDEAIDHLYCQGRADALIASNDIWAVRFIQHLQASGVRVPEDIAVSGYDNLDISTVITPALTTMDQDHDLYAQYAVSALLDDRDGAPRRMIVPRLVVRSSTVKRASGAMDRKGGRGRKNKDAMSALKIGDASIPPIRK